jgi:hypothetical protein
MKLSAASDRIFWTTLAAKVKPQLQPQTFLACE